MESADTVALWHRGIVAFGAISWHRGTSYAKARRYRSSLTSLITCMAHITPTWHTSPGLSPYVTQLHLMDALVTVRLT